MSNKVLEAKMKDGVISISVGVEHLIKISEPKVRGEFTVVNMNEFAKDILSSLESEDDDGTTLMHKMFDEAITNAIDNGSENVEYDQP